MPFKHQKSRLRVKAGASNRPCGGFKRFQVSTLSSFTSPSELTRKRITYSNDPMGNASRNEPQSGFGIPVLGSWICSSHGCAVVGGEVVTLGCRSPRAIPLWWGGSASSKISRDYSRVIYETSRPRAYRARSLQS